MKDFSEIFNTYEEEDGTPYKLLSKKVHFPQDNGELYRYIYVSENIPWTIMSYKLYDTIDYWWVLSSLNKTQPFYAKSGNTIKYIPKTLLEEILKYI